MFEKVQIFFKKIPAATAADIILTHNCLQDHLNSTDEILNFIF